MQRKQCGQPDIQNHRQGMTDKEIQDAINLLDDELDSTDGDEEEDYQVIPSKRKKSSENVSLSLPAKELSKVMSQVFDRSNISVRKQLLVQSAIINSGGESVNSFSLSVSSVWRQRAAERKLKAKEVKENYLKNKPKYTTVHWDSKLIKLVSGKKEERVAILVSGASSGPKIIGIPSVADSTGISQKNAVIEMLDDWQLKQDVAALVFDTTASNTGIRNGCASLIEKDLNRPLLWLACRHHMYEVHIKNIWKAVSGNTVGPEELLFKRFQSDWENIDHDLNDVTLFQWPGTMDDNGKPITSMIASTATEVLKWAKDCYSTSVFPRADYKELLELTILFLGGDVTIKLRKPGALHHARFM
ncbi:Cc8K15.2-like protein, partial [Daphnia magna]